MAKKTKPTMWEEGKTILMPKALHKKWTEALRSGEYTQGNDYLMLDGSFCCLGVLADVTSTLIQCTEGENSLYDEFLLEQGIRFRSKDCPTGENQWVYSMTRY